MNSNDKENMIEEIRQLVNKGGCPEIFLPLLTIIGLEDDPDYETESSESESESDSDSDSDDVGEHITVTLKPNGFYEIGD
tara:strand:- start:1451 stop:1690 length:240 start_codon:yes stop_codon:yes gene_type:complete